MSRACLEKRTRSGWSRSLCEGVRYLLEAPVSVILVDAELLGCPAPPALGLDRGAGRAVVVSARFQARRWRSR